jgi:hypothetical protein
MRSTRTEFSISRPSIVLGVLLLCGGVALLLQSPAGETQYDPTREAPLGSDVEHVGHEQAVDGRSELAARQRVISPRTDRVEGVVHLRDSASHGLGGSHRRIFFRLASARARSTFFSATVQENGLWSAILEGSGDAAEIRVGGCSIDGDFHVPVQAIAKRERDGLFRVHLHPAPGTAVLPFSSDHPTGLPDFELYGPSPELGPSNSVSFPFMEGGWERVDDRYLRRGVTGSATLVHAPGYSPTRLGTSDLGRCIVEPFLPMASGLYVALVDSSGASGSDEFTVSLRSRITGRVESISNQAVGLVAEFLPLDPGEYLVSVYHQKAGRLGTRPAADVGSVTLEPGEHAFIEADLGRASQDEASISGRLELPWPGMAVHRASFIRSVGPRFARERDAYFFAMIQPEFDELGTTATWGPIAVPAQDLDLRLPGGTAGIASPSPGESLEVVERLGVPRRVRVLCIEEGGTEERPAQTVSYARAGLDQLVHGGFPGFFELAVDDDGWATVPEGDVWLRGAIDGRASEWEAVSVRSEAQTVVLPLARTCELHVIVEGDGLVDEHPDHRRQLSPVIATGAQGRVASLAMSPQEVEVHGDALRLVYLLPPAESYLLRPAPVDGAIPIPDRPFAVGDEPHVERLEYVFP